MPEKNRSAGTTVVAILQIIGSALLLLLAAFMAFAMIMATPPANDPRLPPMYFTMMRIVLPLFYAVPAVWGIVTAVGLLQLKNWARISTIVISILLIVFGVFGILTSMVFFLKPPPTAGVDPKIFTIIGAVTAIFSLAQIGVGIWWMVFFNRASVKAQFQPQPFPFPQPGHSGLPTTSTCLTPQRRLRRVLLLRPAPQLPTDVAPLPTPPIAAPQRPTRPLSISIIAWFMLASCIFVPFIIFLHPPVVLLATILSGWQAVVFMLVSAALNIYIGIALLKMKPAGRLVGIGYFIFGLLNVVVFYLAPGRNARLARFWIWSNPCFPGCALLNPIPFQADMTPFFLVGAIGGMAVCLVLLYFLAAAKPAFDRAAQQAG